MSKPLKSMEEDCSDEVKNLIKKYRKEDLRFAKPLDYLVWRNNAIKEEMEEELFSLKDLEFAYKQFRGGETRYALYFIYSRKRGRVYIVHFDEKMTTVTVYPLGRKTLSKYKRRKFIK